METPPLRTRQDAEERCKAPAVRAWRVCRFHGARGGAPKGKRNGMYRHGFYTNEAHEERLACARAPTEVARGAAYSKTDMKYGAPRLSKSVPVASASTRLPLSRSLIRLIN
jgi:hypothetical protein